MESGASSNLLYHKDFPLRSPVQCHPKDMVEFKKWLSPLEGNETK